MTTFIGALENEFIKNANAKIALQQKAYLRGQFEFYGLTTTVRREIQRPFLIAQFPLPKKDLSQLVQQCMNRPQREYHYFAQELAFKYVKELEKKDIDLYEFMVCHKSWWDTVDFIATKLIGAYFKKYPEQIAAYVEKWLNSDHIWLKRSALLFQLKYKNELDPDILGVTITKLLHSKEFFINKAIGWILREYSRTDPNWVEEFVNKTDLSNLSKREALRLIS
ncbi:MAG: DNA alkylation repair protein [Flavobacteriaceae bacterium]